jgi:hypothetical protein
VNRISLGFVGHKIFRGVRQLGADPPLSRLIDRHVAASPSSLEHKAFQRISSPHAGNIWKYDPDIEADLTGQQWMRDCLFAAAYPPPDASHAGSGK